MQKSAIVNFLLNEFAVLILRAFAFDLDPCEDLIPFQALLCQVRLLNREGLVVEPKIVVLREDQEQDDSCDADPEAIVALV